MFTRVRTTAGRLHTVSSIQMFLNPKTKFNNFTFDELSN